MAMKDRMHTGALYLPGDDEITDRQQVCLDIPANVVAVGNPCRVLRPISDRDKKYYFKDRLIDHTEIARDLEKIK